MKVTLILIFLLILSSSKSWSAKAPIKSVFSDISKCKSIKSDEFSETLECKSKRRYNVYIEVMDMYSGLIVQDKKTKYNVVEMINEIPSGKCTVGAFTYVSGKKIEWYYQKGNLIGLVVEVTGTDVLTPDHREVSSKCVIKINERKFSTVLGLADSSKEAKKLLIRNL